MAFLDDIKTEFAGVVCDATNGLGEACTYTVNGGSSTAINCIVVDESVEEEDYAEYMQKVTRLNVTFSRSATDGIATVNTEDAVTIRGKVCEIEDILEISPFSNNVSLKYTEIIERGFNGRRIPD